MAESLAELLRGLRGARGLSLAQLAARSQVSERTLSYWEAGTRQPRLPELEMVLAALETRTAQRNEALTLLSGPRGARELRLSPEHIRHENAIGMLPSGGDLLRALRHRRGLYLEQVAAQMGVSGATVSRWEQGKVVPPPDRLDALLTLLGARQGERAALKEGYLFLMTPLRAYTQEVSDLRENFEAFMRAHYATPDDRLDDLSFLSFEAQAWTLTVRDSSGRNLLAAVCANYAAFLAASGRMKEAGQYAWRALDLLEASSSSQETFTKETALRGAIIAAQSEVFQGTRPAPERGLKILQSWRSVAVAPMFQAWILSNMGGYLALQADWEAALILQQEACRVAERDSDPDQLRFRQMDLARVELSAGRAERVLSLVTLSAQDFPSRRARIELLFAEALLVLEERANAHFWLERANADILANDLTYLQSRSDALTKRL